MKMDFRVKQEFGCDLPITPKSLLTIFQGVSQHLDLILGTQKKWYEQGFSRKSALNHQVFFDDELSKELLIRWVKDYEKEYPDWTAGIWDGQPDGESAGIDCYLSYSGLGRRKNPLSLVVSFYVDINKETFTSESVLWLLNYLLKVNKYCTYLQVESMGYSFPEVIAQGNSYSEMYKKAFPDRIPCGWMLYLPSVISPDVILEAARVIPVIHENKQTGTIIVSTEDVFDGNNKDHIAKANDIEIRLLDLGLLPLMTEL